MKCDNCKISINGMDTRLVVTEFLGVHLDFQLNWSKHLSGITNKIANHVSVMYRVRKFTVQSVHSFCRQACLPYLNYCCEAWGNTYKSRIQPLYILFWLPSKPKIALANLAKVDTFLLAKLIFF